MAGERYTHGHHEAVLSSHRSRTAENSAAYLLPHLEAGQRLLDVGCGPGTITADLAALVAPGQVVALEGYLVKVISKDGWRWQSSLTRNDTGNGACEVIWVEEVEIR